MWRVVIVAGLFTGGWLEPPHADRRLDAADGTAGPLDAAPDGPPNAPSFIVNDGVATVTSLTVPAAYTGTTSRARLFVYNTEAAMSAAVTSTISGTDAASYEIDAASTTCGTSLAGHDGRWLQVAFTPTTAGTKDATLVVAGGSSRWR